MSEEIKNQEEEKEEIVEQNPEKPTEDKEDKQEKYCYLCHRPESKVPRLITIPNNIWVCSDCMQKTFDQIGMRGMPSFGEIPGVEFINLGGPFGGLPEEMQKRHQERRRVSSMCGHLQMKCQR